MAISTVLLDAGGVLLDESAYELLCERAITEVLGDVVPGYSADQYREDVEDAVRCFCPTVPLFILWKHLGDDRSAYEAARTSFLDRCRAQRPPLKLSDGLGEELPGISRHFDVGIAGQYGAELLDLLREHGLLCHFAHRSTQDDFTLTKPDPRYYEQICRSAGVAPEQCIMVGDRIDKDVIPARMVGMGTVLVRAGLHRNQQARTPEELPDAEIAGIRGLAEVVLRVAERS